MPADHGRGLYQEQSVAPARPAAGKLNPEGSFEQSELRALRAVVQESELLPKGKVLKDQIPTPSQGRAKRAQQGDNDGPHGRPAWSVSQVAVKSGDPFLAKDRLRRERAALEGEIDAQQEPAERRAPVRQEPEFGVADALAEWMRLELVQAGDEGIPLGRLREYAFCSGITKSPGTFYRAKRKLNLEVGLVEFRANAEDPREPARIRLRTASSPRVADTREKPGT